MIFFPALAAVQMWYVNDWRAQVQKEAKNSTKSVMPRQETNFECYRLDETCHRIHLFTADGDDTMSCEEVLEHGPLCL
jgi:hypothetical protein